MTPLRLDMPENGRPSNDPLWYGAGRKLNIDRSPKRLESSRTYIENVYVAPDIYFYSDVAVAE